MYWTKSRPWPALIVGALLMVGDLQSLRAFPATACVISTRTAATLLFPYFEVDLADSGGRTTLISIQHPREGNALVHVVLWSDWGIPTAAFDLALKAHEVRTFNLRDLLTTGRAPLTRPAGSFPGCPAQVGGQFIAADLLEAAHTGQPVLGKCFSSPRADHDFATGYLTVDLVRRCSSNATTPKTPGYFTGANPIASNSNWIAGDFFLVDPGGNSAMGENAVHVQAYNGEFQNGDWTFYNRFVQRSGADQRQALASRWQGRAVIGGAFDGGTELLVWRDTDQPNPGPVNCGNNPPWYPLETVETQGWPESGAPGVTWQHTNFFPLATQRVNVRAVLDPPFDFGSLAGSFAQADHPSQGWIIWLASAESRYAVGQSGRMSESLVCHCEGRNCPGTPR